MTKHLQTYINCITGAYRENNLPPFAYRHALDAGIELERSEPELLQLSLAERSIDDLVHDYALSNLGAPGFYLSSEAYAKAYREIRIPQLAIERGELSSDFTTN